jgi:hypothetical protein
MALPILGYIIIMHDQPREAAGGCGWPLIGLGNVLTGEVRQGKVVGEVRDGEGGGRGRHAQYSSAGTKYFRCIVTLL